MNDMRKHFFRIAATSMFTAVLLPLFVLGMIVGAINYHVLHEEIDRSNAWQMDYMSEHFNSLTRDLERLNESVATKPSVTLWLKKLLEHMDSGGVSSSDYALYNTILDFVNASAYRSDYIDSIYIYFDAVENRLLSSQKRLAHMDDYGDTGWLDDYRTADPFQRLWGSSRTVIQADGTEREYLTTFYRIFAGGTGLNRGVLVLNIDRLKVNEMLDSMDDEWDACTFVVNEEGDVLFANSHFQERFGGRNLVRIIDTETDGAWRDNQFVDKRIRIDGIPYLCKARAVGSYGWRMLRLSPESSLYAAPRRISLILMTVLFVVMLFGAMFAYGVAKGNNCDLDNVMHSIQRAKRGDAPESLSRMESKRRARNLYSDMLLNVVDTFIEKEYLTMQLAERRNHAKLLELQALQSQLNPHFLFNTMTIIQWKTIGLTGGHNDASDMIENLSDLLHYVLDNGTDFSTIGEELDIADSYVNIQRIRYGKRFDYLCVCEEGLENARVMKMLVQPLVENSIFHGLAEDDRMLTVEVRVYAQENQLCILVHDDGLGMEPGRLDYVRRSLNMQRKEDGKHIGLYNVNKRIKLSYGEEYGLEVDSVRGEGTDIVLKIPLESKNGIDDEEYGRRNENEPEDNCQPQ